MPSAIRNSEQWERLPDRLGVDPQPHAEAMAILAAIRRLIDIGLTAYEQRVSAAIAVDGIPLDALTARLGVRRGATYKMVFDARCKNRRELDAHAGRAGPECRRRRDVPGAYPIGGS